MAGGTKLKVQEGHVTKGRYNVKCPLLSHEGDGGSKLGKFLSTYLLNDPISTYYYYILSLLKCNDLKLPFSNKLGLKFGTKQILYTYLVGQQ